MSAERGGMQSAVETPLATLYARASRPCASVDDAEALRDALRARGERVGEEMLEEMSVGWMKYALVDRFVARAWAGKDASRACDACEGFLDVALRVGGVPRSEVGVVERETGARAETEGGGETRDGREEKIRRFKARRRCEERMREIERMLKGSVGDDESSEDEEVDHEALEREYWTLRVESEVYETLDELPSLRLEREMLARRSELDEARRAEREAAESDERVRDRRPETYRIEREHVDALAGPSVLAFDSRARARADVFKPTVALPTMTVEEFGEIERREMLDRQRREAARALQAERDRASKSEDQIEEEELQKARAWDAFKDDNPYGSGNSKLRPCS